MNILLRECKHALKLNLKPGLVLQAIALILVFSYYNSSSVQEALKSLTELKAQNSYLFSGLSTCLFAAIIPYSFLCLSGRRRFNAKVLVFMLGLWFWKGAEIELFYSYQAELWGTGTDALTLFKKVMFDQLVFSTVYAVPCIVICYLWKDNNFSFKAWKEALTKDLFKIKIPSVIVSNWLIWMPACAVIYSMPTALQVPLSNIICCFFVLIIEVLCDPNQGASSHGQS